MINYNTNLLQATVPNASGSQFNVNMDIISTQPYFYAINTNIAINILNQILVKAQQDLTVIQGYSTNFLPSYTATQILLNGKLFTDSSLTIQDFFNYIKGKTTIVSTTGDNYYKIANSSTYTIEYQKFITLTSNLRTFYDLVLNQQKTFDKYYKFLDIYNNFMQQFENVFFSTNYQQFTAAYNIMISKIRDSFTMSGQIYATSNEQNIIKVTNDWFTITYVSNGLYTINLSGIQLPVNTIARFYNNFVYVDDSNVDTNNAQDLFSNQIISSTEMQNNFINPPVADFNDYIALPTDKTLAYTFMFDNVTKRVSLTPNVALDQGSGGSGSSSAILPFALSKIMSNVIFANQAPDISTNFNYYTKTFLEANMPKYNIGDIREENVSLDEILPNYYIQIYRNRILLITAYQSLYNEIKGSLTFLSRTNNRIYNPVFTESLFAKRTNNGLVPIIGTVVKSQNSLHHITAIGINYIELDGALDNVTSFDFIDHPLINYSDIDNMTLCPNFIDNNLPLAGSDGANLFSSETKQNITLGTQHIPPFNYVGVNTSLYGYPFKGDPIVIPATNADSNPIEIRKVESYGLLNEVLGNVSPNPINIQQSIGIMYNLFIKIL